MKCMKLHIGCGDVIIPGWTNLDIDNLPGVDVVAAKDLSAEDLAPGGDLGRLTVFTKTAVEALN